MFSITLLPTLFLLFASASAQNTKTTTKTEAITTAFLRCSNQPSSTCPNTYKIETCLSSTDPNIWELYDAHHNSSSTTNPLITALSNSKLKSCVCAESTLQGLETCVECVRKESGIKTGEIDLFGVGFIAERVCGVVLPGFGLNQTGRDGVSVLDSLPPTTTRTNNSTTTPTPGPKNNETDIDLGNGGGKNGTDSDSSTGGKNGTSTPGKNETVQTPTPTPTQSDDQPSASESEAAAVKLAGEVVRHVAGPAGIAAVVAFGMSFL